MGQTAFLASGRRALAAVFGKIGKEECTNTSVGITMIMSLGTFYNIANSRFLNNLQYPILLLFALPFFDDRMGDVSSPEIIPLVIRVNTIWREHTEMSPSEGD